MRNNHSGTSSGADAAYRPEHRGTAESAKAAVVRQRVPPWVVAPGPADRVLTCDSGLPRADVRRGGVPRPSQIRSCLLPVDRRQTRVGSPFFARMFRMT